MRALPIWLAAACGMVACSDESSPARAADMGTASLDASTAVADAGAAGHADAGGHSDASTARHPEDVTALIAARRSTEGLVALGGAVVDEDGLLAVGVDGLRSSGDAVPVTVDDRWHLGSDTKSMTAMLAAVLVEQGVLTWDQTLAETFPEFADEMNTAYRSMTIVELVSHRAGLPNAVPDDLWMELWQNQGTMIEQRARFARALLARAPSTPPGSAYEYSNAGFIMAGAMMEKVTGRSWETLMEAELFEPLGMTDCGFGPAATDGALDAPLGHREGTPPVPVPAGPMADNPPALGPAGTVHCPLASWALYIAAHLRRGGDGALLPTAAFERLHADPGIGTPPSGFGYGYGWFVLDRPWAGGLTLNHAGSNTMNYAVAWVAPLKNRAYLVVTNYAGADVPAAADRAIVDLLTRYPPD